MVRAAGEECLVLGWVDHPFAEACSLCGVTQFMLLLCDDPPLAHRILAFLTDIVIDFALAQLDAGAPMIGAGDAAASLLSAPMYGEFALPYERLVFAAIHGRGGLGKLHICGNTTQLLALIPTCGADLFNVDHLVDFETARAAYGAAGLCFKGNLDPVADFLHVSPADCRKRALARLHAARGMRYMLSAGCEIPAAVPDETLRAFCAAPLEAAAS
jgi:MtaA/CmuA family methyltransferase